MLCACLQAQCAECGDLHEIAKTAKQRIAEIQEQYMKRADEINAMLLEKHKIEVNPERHCCLRQVNKQS